MLIMSYKSVLKLKTGNICRDFVARWLRPVLAILKMSTDVRI